jgi:hypothetical protein
VDIFVSTSSSQTRGLPFLQRILENFASHFVSYARKEGTTDEPVVRGDEDEGEDYNLQQHWQGKQGDFPGFSIVSLRREKALAREFRNGRLRANQN